ncbi:MAG: pantetheine-phosphate adenylyltransferase [Micrococcales bacterium]
MTRIAVYPGSFDPLTFGHLDIAARAARLFDEVHILVVHNPGKTPRFSSEERVELIRASMPEAARYGVSFPSSANSKVIIDTLDGGLLADYCHRVGASVLVKGVRNGVDIDYEVPMARVNRDLAGVETVLIPADPSQGFVSSSLVKQVADLGGSVEKYVPSPVVRALAATAKNQK